MRKELIIVSLLLVLIFGTNYICQKCLDNVINDMQDKFNRLNIIINDMIKRNKYESDYELDSILGETDNSWSKYKITLSLFLEHDELEKIDDSVIKIRSYIDVKDYEDTVAEVNRCIFLLNHLKQKQSMQIINIF